MQHKGYNIEPKWCDPSKDWGQYKGWFHVELPNNTIFAETYQKTIDESKTYIDSYLNINIESNESIFQEISSCFTSQGYDSIDIDETKLKLILLLIQK